MESKEEFKHISLDYFEKNKNTDNIESMVYKNLPKDSICIKLNSLFFSSPLDKEKKENELNEISRN